MGESTSRTQLVKPQTSTEKDDRKNTDKEDERASGHLIDRDRGVEQADVHQLYSRIVTEEGNETAERDA